MARAVTGVGEDPAGLRLRGPRGRPTTAFWTDDLNIFNGTISSVPLAGGTATTVLNGLNSPQGIAADANNIYWADFGDGTVNRYSLTDATRTALVQGQGGVGGVAVDSTGVYWTTATGSSTGGAIRYAPFNASGVGAETILIGGLNAPTGVAVEGGQVFWTDNLNQTVNTRAISGGPVTVIARGQAEPNGVAVSGGQAYRVNSDGTINAAPIGGGGPVATLYSSIFDIANGVAIGP